MVLFALCCTDCFVWQNVWLLYSGQDILQCTVSFLSSILIYTDMVYFKYIYGINKYEKRYLLVVLNLYGDILWESQWNGTWWWDLCLILCVEMWLPMPVLPWYNRTGGLGIKHQLTYFPRPWICLLHLCWTQVWMTENESFLQNKARCCLIALHTQFTYSPSWF